MGKKSKKKISKDKARVIEFGCEFKKDSIIELKERTRNVFASYGDSKTEIDYQYYEIDGNNYRIEGGLNV